jgi:hypothetical protein
MRIERKYLFDLVLVRVADLILSLCLLRYFSSVLEHLKCMSCKDLVKVIRLPCTEFLEMASIGNLQLCLSFLDLKVGYFDFLEKKLENAAFRFSTLCCKTLECTSLRKECSSVFFNSVNLLLS